MSERKYTEGSAGQYALLISLFVAVTLAAVVFAFKYADMRAQRDALVQRETLRQHDEALLKGQRDYTVREMTARANDRANELYPGASQDGEVKLLEPPPTIIEDSDTPEAIREIDERHAREDAAGQQRSYSPGLPQ